MRSLDRVPTVSFIYSIASRPSVTMLMKIGIVIALVASTFLSTAFGDGCSQAGICNPSQTCCPVSGSHVDKNNTIAYRCGGCCPLTNGVCCSDRQHCCPSGYQCQQDGSCRQGDPQTTTPDDDRQAMINANNAYRSKLTKGLQPDRNGRMNPTGRNMYKLAWDCQLEREAQAWSDACVYAHSSSSQRHGAGENLYAQYGRPLDPHSNFIAAADSWWGEATTIWTTRANNVFTSGDINAGHFTQMAWGKTYKVGCGISACRGIFGSNLAAYVVCRYVDAGNYVNQPVYEPGTPCSGSNACSTSIASSCEASSGLCVSNSDKELPEIEKVVPKKNFNTLFASTFHLFTKLAGFGLLFFTRLSSRDLKALNPK